MRPAAASGRRLLPAFLLAAAAVAVPVVAPSASAQGGGAAADSSASVLPTRSASEFFLAPAAAAPVQLGRAFVVTGSLRLLVDGTLWREGQDYRLRARSGVIVPLRAWIGPHDGPGAPARALVLAEYEFLPVPAEPRVDLRPMSPAPATTAIRPAGQEAAPAPAGASPLGRLDVNGSKTVQVSSGSRREMTVDQNLRLSINGQLTPEIAVRAFLSDDNLPVVPEGNTEELRDIDKVLVELTAPRWRATLGDFVARREGTVFGAYRRKLQGVSLQATPGDGEVEVLAGSPRGVYRTVQLQGQESNQGPYYLAGGAAAGNLFVVAGSERVTLDGEPMVRGADRDYVIDYVLGTVTFTYRRLITAESEIVIEFEEGEGPYGRTVAGAGAGHRYTVPGAGWEGWFRARIIRERDDPGRLRTGELGPDDEAILAAAGDDADLAVAGGATAVEPGLGRYDQDTVDGRTIYVHAPDGGDWDVAFYYAGPGQGDYRLDALTETGERIYVYAGPDTGAYRVGRPLPMPEQHSVATLSTALGDTSGSHVAAEFSTSARDLNQLSELDGDDDDGRAARVAARLSGREVTLGGRSLGRVDLRGFWEDRDERFRPFQVRKTIHDYEAWGLGERARREGFLDEADRESGLQAGWRAGDRRAGVDLTGSLGSLRHGAGLRADRGAAAAGWRWAGGAGSHSWQRASAEDLDDPLDIRRDRVQHDLQWRLGPVVPGGAYEKRQWRDDAAPAGRAGGFRLEETSARLVSAPGATWIWRAEFKRGLADSLRAGAWRRERDSRTARAAATTGTFGGMRLVGEGTVRRVLQPDGPEQTTRLARVDLAGRWDGLGSDWSVGYGVDNSRTEVMDRQIVYVGEGQGSFNQDGEYVGQDQGDHDMVLAGTDSLVATTGVRADLNWRQGFGFLGEKRWYGAWSSLTQAGIESRSTAEDVGALLRLDPDAIFDPDTSVLTDLRFSEEVTLLQHLRTIDLRGRFDYRQVLDRQFADSPEDRLDRTWQTTATLNVTRRSNVRLRWLQQDERRQTVESSLGARRSQDIATRRYEAGYNLNPSTDLRLGLQGEYVTRADAVSAVSQEETALRPTLRGRPAPLWTVQADVRWSRVVSDEPAGSLRPVQFPYAGGNVESSLRVSWEPSRYLTMSASWFGRRQGERGWQHDVRIESTARF